MRNLESAVLRYVVRCFRRETPPRVSELAELLGMTPSAFTRRFKRQCGENPSTVLKRLQLLYAQKRLLRGNTVNRAAYASGYGTRRSIYRSFRRAFGQTPKRYTRNVEMSTARS